MEEGQFVETEWPVPGREPAAEAEAPGPKPEAEPEPAPEPAVVDGSRAPVVESVFVPIEREELVEIAPPPAALHTLVGEILAGLPGAVDDVVAAVHEQFAAHRLFCLHEVVYDRQERGRVSAKVRYQLVGPAGDSFTSTSYGQGATTGDAVDDAFHTFLTQTFVLSARRPAPAPTQPAAIEPAAAVTEPAPEPKTAASDPAPPPPKKSAIATPGALGGTPATGLATKVQRDPPSIERPPERPTAPRSQEPEPTARVAPPSPPARSSAPGHEPTEDDMICEGSELGYEGCLGRVDTPEQWKFSTFRFRKSLCSVCMPQHNLADKAARKAALEAKKAGTTVVSELS